MEELKDKIEVWFRNSCITRRALEINIPNFLDEKVLNEFDWIWFTDALLEANFLFL